MGKKKLTGWHAGRALRVAREDDGLTVDDMATLLAKASGQRWYGAKVSRIERGEQEATASQVALFRKVQQRPLEWYFDGPTAAAATVAVIPGSHKALDRVRALAAGIRGFAPTPAFAIA